MKVSKYDTLAKYNGRTVVIQRYGEETCLVRYAANWQPITVPTSHLQGDGYDQQDSLQPGVDYA